MCWFMLFAGVIVTAGILFNIESSIFSKHINNLYVASILELTSTIAHTIGFYLLLKRKISGLLVILLLSFIFILVIKDIYTVYYISFVMMFFGTPYLLSYIQFISNEREKT